MEYELFAKDLVFSQVQNLEQEIQDQIFDFFDRIKANPFIESDFKEDRNGYSSSDDVVIVGNLAIVFYVDHAMKEIRILDLLPADEEMD